MKNKPDKPIEYYVNRNQIFECIGVVAWWIVAFIAFALLLMKP